jgi:hypothetical protein
MKSMENEVQYAEAIPTKRFFVSMLTRDISLEDAILDLLDNCLDGALRQSGNGTVDYSKFSVSIELSGEKFLIKDDCGGIPREIAVNYAFKMGRDPDDLRDQDAETIGMYGVGMKRAIFKMGQNASVYSKYNDDNYEVAITPDWLEKKEWSPLPIKNHEHIEALDSAGTLIEINELYPGVSRQFQNKSFINDLTKAIGEHFATFIKKGLRVLVNDQPVTPVHVEVLTSIDENSPAPYVYRKEIDGVVVSIVVGLNTGRRFDEDDVDFERDRSATTAGWTVFCNDRAVIVGDKTRLTGWGDGIPMYHGQFSVITGIVEFKSTSADKLPVTTTKRALDTSSDIWLEARTKMREGLRVWINYTNAWKNNPRSDQSSFWKSAKPASLVEAIDIVKKRNVTKKSDGAIEYNPTKKNVLPKPEANVPSSRKVVFSRPSEEIKRLALEFFDREDESAGVVGDRCFTIVLNQLNKKDGLVQ